MMVYDFVSRLSLTRVTNNKEINVMQVKYSHIFGVKKQDLKIQGTSKVWIQPVKLVMD